MKFMLSLLALGHVALASPVPSLPVNPGGIGGLYKGPGDQTIIKGPDGSIITSAVEGGQVLSELQPIVVAEPAPVAVATVTAAPVIEAVAVPVQPVVNKQSSDLIGPSGRILTQGSQSVVAGPASTTITGPAVVAETVVKGAPIVATPLLNLAPPILGSAVTVTASPITTITGGSIAPLPVTSITSLPIATVTGAEIAPISVTASPLFAGGGLVSGRVPISGASVTTVTAAAPQAVATASTSPHLSVASASASQGASATASAGLNQASAAVETTGQISTVTASPLPISPSSIVPPINEIQGVGVPGLVGINNKIDLSSQLVQDQLALDNRQLGLNPGLIPAANIIPPEIVVTPKSFIGGIRPTPGTLLTTPGLGSVASSTNIQRGEADISFSVTPTTGQLIPQDVLTQQQVLALQNQQILLNNQIQHAQQADELALNNPNQQVGLQSRGEILLPPNADPRLAASGQQVTSLGNIQQQDLLSVELAKSGIDASQIQLTGVPLSAVSGLPLGIGSTGTGIGVKDGRINDGLAAGAWGRYGRKADSKKN